VGNQEIRASGYQEIKRSGNGEIEVRYGREDD
jgi:hypothetical protein